MTIDVKELVELKRGGLYVLQIRWHATAEALEHVRLALQPYEEANGVKFLILDECINLVQAGDLRAAVREILQAVPDAIR